MKSIIKNNILSYLLDKRKMIVLLIFAFFCGTELNTAVQAGMSTFEFALFVMGNHYYVIYFLLVSYIFFLLDNMRTESSLMIIRLRTIRGKYICRLISNLCQTTCFIGAHLVIALLIGAFSLSHENIYKASAIEEYYSDTLAYLSEYTKYINTPLAALLITCVYMILGLTFISMIIRSIMDIAGKKGTIVAIGALFLDIMIGFKSGTGGILEAFFLNNYFILHHVLLTNGVRYLIVNIVCMITVIIAGYYVLKKINGNKTSAGQDYLQEMQRGNITFSLIFLILYVSLCSVYILMVEGEIALMDVAFSCVFGYDASAFDFMEFLKYVLLFVVPIFMTGKAYENEENMLNQQAMLRYESRRKWKEAFNKNINIYLIKYFLIYFASIIIISLLVYITGKNEVSQFISYYMEYAEIGNEIYILIVASFVIKAIELFYYKNIFLLWSYITKNRIAAYLLCFMGFIADILFPESIFISYGSSSLYSLTDGAATKGVTVTLFGTCAIFCIKLVIMKKLNNILEERTI